MTPSPYADTTAASHPQPGDALRVGSATNPGSLAKSIQMTLLEQHVPGQVTSLKIRAMGPQSANQMVKGIAIARQNLVGRGFDLCAQPHFETLTEANENLSVLVMKVTLIDDK
jgi:stage V sporulation protein SpoVS